MSHLQQSSPSHDSGLGGITEERVEQMLQLLPRILANVDEIRGIVGEHHGRFLSVEEFAKIVHRAPYTIRNWIKEGRIEAIRVIGTGARGRLLIPRAEIEKTVCAGLGERLQTGISD
jgi:excisionase family DNA binding protein